MSYHLLTSAEKQEVLEDLITAFNLDNLTEESFREELGKLGKNATDIDDLVKEYRPAAPENDDDFGEV
jgi:hypothetical protein